MGVRRGDLAIVSAPGDCGKPMPAVVLQADRFYRLESVVVALLSSELQAESSLLRIRVAPTTGNGLQRVSEVMLDKILTMSRRKVSEPVGRLSNAEMTEITAGLGLLLGLD